MKTLKELQNHPIVFQSNFGDDAIALIQWLFEASLKNVKIIYINTGWSAQGWKERVTLIEKYLQDIGFEMITLQSIVNFSEAVLGRASFPSKKFSWCSGLLKGLPFLDWLDTVDDQCQTIIVLPKRRTATQSEHNLEEWILRSTYHQERTVWHPIFNLSENERNALLDRAGFKALNHRSLECQPCIHSSDFDLAHLAEEDIEKVAILEQKLGLGCFDIEEDGQKTSIYDAVKIAKEKQKGCQIYRVENNSNYLKRFYSGCGNHFGCGL